MITTRSQDAGVKLWVEVLVFLCSYYPLFLILFIRDIGSPAATVPFGSSNISWWALIGIFISSICTLLTGCIMRKLFTKSEGAEEIILTNVRVARGDMINYTLPFLIGLFAFDYKTFQSIASLIVFLIFMFGFTRKEGIILLNPMFLLMGIRLYDINYKKVGQPKKEHTANALCMGIAKKSESKVRFLENSGINFISETVDR
ncbi:hypothetical protein [Vibrio atlanticus]|uniref:hypothetical protein n=1 Tax=Vibrio atlanticus TaxID=693153 RepID=UPI003D0962CB